MTDTQHTPGPWEFFLWADHMPHAGLPSSVGLPCDADDSYTIADFTEEHSADISKEEQFANARLIVAAPVMLAALERVTLSSSLVNDCKDGQDRNIFQACLDAIAQAKGEEVQS